MPRLPHTVPVLALSTLCLLSGCISPSWMAPVNPFKHDASDRAAAALEAKDYTMALGFYGELVAAEPDNMVAHYQLAEVNRALGRHEEAYRLYRIVYASGAEDDTPLPNGDSSDEPVFRAAERQVRLLRARLGIEDGRMGGKPDGK